MKLQTSFEPLKLYETNEESLYTAFLANKACLFKAKHSVTEKKLNRYLEENSKYSHRDRKDQNVRTVDSEVNRVTKLAPDKVNKKDVVRLVFLSAQTNNPQKPKLYVENFVRIVKKDKALGKRYKQYSSTKFSKKKIF